MLSFDIFAKDRASSILDKVGRSAGTTHRSFGVLSKGAALLGGALAGIGAVALFKDFITEAREAAKITRLTESAIRSTGGAAKISAAGVEKLADNIAALAGVDDDLIQSSANLLLTFTRVRNETGKGNKIFNMAEVAIVDMTAAMNNGVVTQEGLKASTIQVGKALNDPIKGLTALSRVGVTFSAQQKKQIEGFVKAGDIMSAQKIILAELKTEFGGAAAAAADPAQKAQVAWANFKETIGNLLLPILGQLATMFTTKIVPALENKVIPALQQAGKWIGENVVPKVRELAATWLPRLQQLFAMVAGIITSTVIPAVAATVGWFTRHETLIRNLAVAIGVLIVVTKLHAAAMAVQAAGGILAFMTTYLKSIKLVQVATKVWAALQWLLNTALFANPIGLVILAVIALVAIIVLIATKTRWFQNIWNAAWGGIKAAALTVGRWFAGPFAGFFVRLWQVIVSGVVGAKNWVVNTFNQVVAFVRGIPDRILASVGNLARLLYNVGRDIVQGMINGIRDMIGRLTSSVRNAISAIPNTAKRILGISSPSKVFFGFGKETIRGYMQGIQSETGHVDLITRAFTPAPRLAPVAMQATSPTVIEIRSGGTRMDDLFVELLRRAIRVRGGNVQVVLGRG